MRARFPSTASCAGAAKKKKANLKKIPPSFVLFLALAALFIFYVRSTSASLPDRVANHFVAGGVPNGWMTRSQNTTLTLMLGLGIPLIIFVVFYGIRFIPVRFINLPYKNYWLAPERTTESFDWMFEHAGWFGVMELIFITGVHALIVDANRAYPAHLRVPLLMFLVLGLLFGIAIWTYQMFRRFKAPSSL